MQTYCCNTCPQHTSLPFKGRYGVGMLLLVMLIHPAHGQAVNRLFESDLYRPVISNDVHRPRWEIDDALLSQAHFDQTRCSLAIDQTVRFNGQPTFRIDPKPNVRWGNVQWVKPVQAGQLYRFSGVYRNSGRLATDPPVFMPMYAFLSIHWLDANGVSIATRDRLRSRPSTEDFWNTLEVQAIAPPGAVNARLLLTAGYNATAKDRKGLHAWFGDLRWGPAQLSPLTLDLWPRLLRTTNEIFEIQVGRSHDASVAWDGCLRVELLDPRGKVVRQWITAKLVTLPWTTRTRLPKDAGDAQGWSVRVAIDPYQSYQGKIDWQITEPILVANSDIVNRLQDGFFVVDGQKRFVIGVYHALPRDYLILKNAGFNTILTKNYDADEAVEAYDNLAKLGMWGIASVGGGGQTRGNVPRTEAMVKALQNHRSLLAWNLVDEPTRKGIGPREVAWHSQWLQSISPRVPTTVNVCGPYQFYRFASTVDVLAVDPYPNASWLALATKYDPNPDMSMVTRWLGLAEEHLPAGRGYTGVIECFTHPGQRPPTSKELSSSVYQSLIGGATSITYFAVRFGPQWYLPDQPIYPTVQKVNQEIAQLEPWLVQGRLPEHQQPLQIDTDRPDQLAHATWLYQGQCITLIANLSRKMQRIRIEKRSKNIGKEVTSTLKLAPLEIKTLRYPASGDGIMATFLETTP